MEDDNCLNCSLPISALRLYATFALYFKLSILPINTFSAKIWDTTRTSYTWRTRNMRRGATLLQVLGKDKRRANQSFSDYRCKCYLSSSLVSGCGFSIAYTCGSDCCALSLQPFKNPVAVLSETKAGEAPRADVFDLLNIVPYIRKFKSSELGRIAPCWLF